jgi:hypothetical protein
VSAASGGSSLKGAGDETRFLLAEVLQFGEYDGLEFFGEFGWEGESSASITASLLVLSITIDLIAVLHLP